VLTPLAVAVVETSAPEARWRLALLAAEFGTTEAKEAERAPSPKGLSAGTSSSRSSSAGSGTESSDEPEASESVVMAMGRELLALSWTNSTSLAENRTPRGDVSADMLVDRAAAADGNYVTGQVEKRPVATKEIAKQSLSSGRLVWVGTY
jgi:hypothetical protein